jgi:predicted DNA-binding protein (MmcQ/YjbR family)
MDIEALRAICLSFPSVTEDIKWGNDLCFSTGGKLFCLAGLHAPLQVSLKVTKKDFADLTDGIRIVPAPYLARYDWILVKDTACLSRTEWLHYLEQSYKLVKAKLSKKDREELEK